MGDEDQNHLLINRMQKNLVCEINLNIIYYFFGGYWN